MKTCIFKRSGANLLSMATSSVDTNGRQFIDQLHRDGVETVPKLLSHDADILYFANDPPLSMRSSPSPTSSKHESREGVVKPDEKARRMRPKTAPRKVRRTTRASRAQSIVQWECDVRHFTTRPRETPPQRFHSKHSRNHSFLTRLCSTSKTPPTIRTITIKRRKPSATLYPNQPYPPHLALFLQQQSAHHL